MYAIQISFTTFRGENVFCNLFKIIKRAFDVKFCYPCIWKSVNATITIINTCLSVSLGYIDFQ